MQYDCECGCGEKVEKTIAFSDACRMRVKRNTVRNPNTTVRKTNNSVQLTNIPVRNPNKEVVYLYTPSCPRGHKEIVEQDEGVFCKLCSKYYAKQPHL
jgi:hypothetical protein